jgi:hypothetical protein
MFILFKVTGKVTIKVTWKKGEKIGSGAEWKMSLL